MFLTAAPARTVWVNLNKELWASKESITTMTAKIQKLEDENSELRAQLSQLQA